MDQSNNLVAAFNVLAAGLVGTGKIIPGGLQMSKSHMKAPPARPYGQVWCELDGKPIFTSGLSYCQNYLLEVTVWCGDDNIALKGVDAALDALIPFSTKFENTGYLTESSKTTHVVTVPGGVDQEESRANQQLVGVVKRTWRVLLNQTRTSQ